MTLQDGYSRKMKRRKKMAREILFKAKRIDNGEWVEGSFITGVFCRYYKERGGRQ